MRFVISTLIFAFSASVLAASYPAPLKPLATCAGVTRGGDVVVAILAGDVKSFSILIGPGPAALENLVSVDPSTSTSGTTYRSSNYALKVRGERSSLVQRQAEDESDPIPLVCQSGK